MRLCVIGDPVGHSLSPLLHRRMLDRAGLTGSYETVTVTPDTLPEFLAAARAGAWDGCNVTMPLKQAILPLLDGLDPAAAAYGAVNTVCFRRGRSVGYNTDAPGIRAGLLAHGADPRAGQVLIIGNGGAARAGRFALGDCRLLTAARHGGDIPLDRLSQAARGSLVVINATPLGMEGFPPFASLSFLDALPPGAAVFDLVYHPRQTALLAAARDRGLTAIGGMELLVQQAILAFSRFTGTALLDDGTPVRVKDFLGFAEKVENKW